MAETEERRREKRLQYNWPVWFAANFDGELSQGQMMDISSGGAAFTCYSDKCPHGEQKITTRFSVPLYDEENSFDLENFIRDGRICRIDEISPYIRKVAIQFAEPLPFKPAEMDSMLESDKQAENDELTEAEARAMASVPEQK
jgi:hypothetical protein